ncbi:MAG TPA: MerR family transcriptional regulator [Clostridiales bacterium]|nr:MerR family transcriptional regulator [Clostridiales bacterium]
MTIKEVSKKFGITMDTLRYYERVGMIPPVTRSTNGNRDYQDDDLNWVSLAICMRSAGLPVEGIARYVKLYQEGNTTISERHQLLINQKNILKEQRHQIDETLERLDKKIERYEVAVETGELTWLKGGQV